MSGAIIRSSLGYIRGHAEQVPKSIRRASRKALQRRRIAVFIFTRFLECKNGQRRQQDDPPSWRLKYPERPERRTGHIDENVSPGNRCKLAQE